MKLSDKIYACRTRAKLSQEELAEQVGVSRQAVSRWECGDNVPEPGKLLMLARLFGVTADWLLDDAQEMPADTTSEAEKPSWTDSLVEGCRSLAHRFDKMLDECVPAGEEQAASQSEIPPDAEPEPQSPPVEEATQNEDKPHRTLTETFHRLVDRFGWKLGVYTALVGIVLALLSSLAQQVLAALGGLMTAGGVILTVILLSKREKK